MTGYGCEGPCPVPARFVCSGCHDWPPPCGRQIARGKFCDQPRADGADACGFHLQEDRQRLQAEVDRLEAELNEYRRSVTTGGPPPRPTVSWTNVASGPPPSAAERRMDPPSGPRREIGGA